MDLTIRPTLNQLNWAMFCIRAFNLLCENSLSREELMYLKEKNSPFITGSMTTIENFNHDTLTLNR